MLQVPPELAELIRRRIDAMRVDPLLSWPNRICKEELGACILHGDNVSVWALRPDGAVFRLDGDSLRQEAEPVTDAAELRRLCILGAEGFPELKALVQANFGSAAAEAIRPVGAWMDRIDRGDLLHLTPQGALEQLRAGRLAGHYVVALPGRLIVQPAPGSREGMLRTQLTDYAALKPVIATWREVQAGGDVFDSVRHGLRFHGRGDGGGWTIEYARQADGSVAEITTLFNDWDPVGSGPERTTTVALTEAEARTRVLREIGATKDFPAIIVRG